jgi:hypothetical protein
MASNSALAIAGATGVAYVTPTTTTAPAVGFASLPSDWHDLGYISDDGMTADVNDDRKEWTPWGSVSPIRTQITKSTKTFKITCWETNEEVLSLYYRQPLASVAPVPATNVISFNDIEQPTPDRRSFVFDVLDGANLFRIYLPTAEVTERGGVVHKSEDLVAYEMTITAYPNTSGVAVSRSFKLSALS